MLRNITYDLTWNNSHIARNATLFAINGDLSEYGHAMRQYSGDGFRRLLPASPFQPEFLNNEQPFWTSQKWGESHDRNLHIAQQYTTEIQLKG